MLRGILMGDTKQKVLLLAARGEIGADLRDVLLEICDAIDTVNAPITAVETESTPVTSNVPSFIPGTYE